MSTVLLETCRGLIINVLYKVIVHQVGHLPRILFTLLRNKFRSMAINYHGVKRAAQIWHIIENTIKKKTVLPQAADWFASLSFQLWVSTLKSYRPIIPRIIQSNTFFFLEHPANRQTTQEEESGILHFKAVPPTFRLLVEALYRLKESLWFS